MGRPQQKPSQPEIQQLLEFFQQSAQPAVKRKRGRPKKKIYQQQRFKKQHHQQKQQQPQQQHKQVSGLAEAFFICRHFSNNIGNPAFGKIDSIILKKLIRAFRLINNQKYTRHLFSCLVIEYLLLLLLHLKLFN
jgi:hypothetical protein